ncbi:RNA-binding protein [Bacillus sp. FJAT-47783]|uniref:YlmH family RNA-binding protein n=1 Tax=Bacillus sp. FJAT-47783 TaxID=2922712 RepID=UPI001FAE23CA|nr:RNA-binding protein [Bacillus sp. FJAT-47783]
MEGIFQHFRENERHFIEMVLEWKNVVEGQYRPKLTDFLDPREQWIVQSVIGHHHDVKVAFFGGSEHVERKRALLYPDYFALGRDDFQLSVYEIDYPKKFVKLEHRQVLGSLMSLGVKRTKFGDILIEGDRIQVIVAKEIESFVEMNFQEVGRTNVSLRKVNGDEVIETYDRFEERMTTTSSLRLDTVCSSIYNLSRQKTKPFIHNGDVKVNWKIVEDASFEVGEGDLISVRGFGRCKIQSIEGRTKKDKIKMIVGVQK